MTYPACWRLVGIAVLVTSVWSAPGRAACTGDCNGDDEVTVDEIVRAVNIALDNVSLDLCSAVDTSRDGEVTVDEILAAVNAAILGCPPAATATPAPPTALATPTTTATPTSGLDPQNPPTTAAALRQWLQAGVYKSWRAEPAIHPSGGPHGGTVRTYLNDVAYASLEAGNDEHPRGTALVKEMYFGTDRVLEWAVEIKVEDSSANGVNWYWYEGIGLSGRGLGICTGCHGADYGAFVSRDYVLTPFPLQ